MDKQLKICCHGLIHPQDEFNVTKYCYPHPIAVKFCKQWIFDNCLDSYRWSTIDSYGFKHWIEDNSQHPKFKSSSDYLYIPNGAFIQAAHELSFSYKSMKIINGWGNRQYAVFKMRVVKDKTAHFRNWSPLDHLRILNQTWSCNNLHHPFWGDGYLKSIKKNRSYFIGTSRPIHELNDDILINETLPKFSSVKLDRLKITMEERDKLIMENKK